MSQKKAVIEMFYVFLSTHMCACVSLTSYNGWTASSQNSSDSASLCSHTHTLQGQAFKVGPGDLNTGSHACAAIVRQKSEVTLGHKGDITRCFWITADGSSMWPRGPCPSSDTTRGCQNLYEEVWEVFKVFTTSPWRQLCAPKDHPSSFPPW